VQDEFRLKSGLLSNDQWGLARRNKAKAGSFGSGLQGGSEWLRMGAAEEERIDLLWSFAGQGARDVLIDG